MNQKLNIFIDAVFNLVFYGLVLLILFFFANLTSDVFETPKLILLIVFTLILLILWGIRSVISGKFSLIHTPIDLPLILLLGVLIISTIFSQTRYVSILGNLPRIHGGLVAYVVYILFYFVVVSNLKHLGTIKNLVYLIVGSGTVLSILSLLSLIGIKYLPLAWTGYTNFTPTGSTFSTNAVLILAIPFLLVPMFQNAKGESFLKDLNIIGFKALLAILLALFLITIILTGTLSTYIALAAVIGLTLFAVPQKEIEKNIIFLVFPAAVAALIIFLAFAPVGGSRNILHSKVQDYPREIQLPFDISWNISVSTFRDSPFFGSGPATYLFDFTAYKPLIFNSTKFWNIRFEQPFNEYLQILATSGAPGLIVLMLLTVVFLSKAFKSLTSSADPFILSLTISGVSLFILLALHASTLVLWVIGVLILAAFFAAQKDTTQEFELGMIGVNRSNNQLNLRFDALPMVLILLIIALVGVSIYYGGRFVVADFHHRQALNAVASGNGLEAYNRLIEAEKLNPYTDSYRIDLAQISFAIANAIAVSKGPSESSPAGSLTDQDKQNIQTLLSQAINEGRAATTLVSKNPANWEVLGSIYRQISGVAQDALLFSLDSYGRAIQQDPLNPLLRLTAGGLYYSVRNYDLAIRFFTDAINLKPDYANAYYNLAVAYKDKGDINSAAVSMEKAVSLLEQNSTDYKTASDFLADLKTQVASQAATLTEKQAAAQRVSETTAPAAKSEPVLQDKNLPKLDLPKEETIATPEAIKNPAE